MAKVRFTQPSGERKKQTVYDQIFRKTYPGEHQEIPIGDLPKDLQPTDLLIYHTEDAFYSENNSYDAFTEIEIQRPRLETDEEYEARIKDHKEFLEDLKNKRYEAYLNLKKEFEPENQSFV